MPTSGPASGNDTRRPRTNPELARSDRWLLSPLPGPPVKPARAVQLLGHPDPIGLLAITVGKDRTSYLLERIPADFGTAFALTKLVLVEIEPGVHEQRHAETYHVHLDAALGHSCTCLGFLHYGMGRDGTGCRHIASLAEMLGRGLL